MAKRFGVNHHILMGNLADDPETRFTSAGKQMTTFTVKSCTHFDEQIDYTRCTAWGKTAEMIAEYFVGGSPIYLEGSTHVRKHDDKYFTNFVVKSFNFIPRDWSEDADNEYVEPGEDEPEF